ncbi:Protein pbn1 [Penicillium longicatenatum]|nr:Protein pbn1 [Penicillium longicatenatum]
MALDLIGYAEKALSSRVVDSVHLHSSTMKRRVTYIQRPEAPYAPEQVSVRSGSISIDGLDAAREDRITFNLDDLPAEIRAICRQSQELHIRWATERSFDAVAPFASRVSPGLHVHYTPVAADQSSDPLCLVLRTVFGVTDGDQHGVDCTSPEDSFIAPPLRAAGPGAATSLHYHTQLPSLMSLVDFLQKIACVGDSTCNRHAETLFTADVVDLDFDTTSNTFTMSGIWAHAPKRDMLPRGWVESIERPVSKADKVEFGLLGTEKAIDADEIKVGGLLAVVGEDKKLSTLDPMAATCMAVSGL